MKQFMKKVVSMVLVFAMLFVPMTNVWAATGTEDSPAALVVGGGQNTANYNGEEAYVYEWTATANGVLTLTFADSGNGWNCEVLLGSSRVTGSSNFEGSTCYFLAEQGKTYKFEITTPYGSPANIKFTANLEVGAKLPGSIENPIALNDATSFVTVGKKTYYKAAVEAGKNYTLSVSCKTQGTFTVYTSDVRTGMEKGTVSENSMVSITVQSATNELVFALEDSRGSQGGSSVLMVTLAKELSDEELIGTSEELADELVLDKNTVVTVTDVYNIYYYTYTADEDGVLVVTMQDNACAKGWMYSVSGGEAEAIYEVSSDGGVNSKTYAFKAGETLKVMFSTASYKAGSVTFKATLSDDAGLEPGPSEVVGTFDNPDELTFGEVSTQITEENTGYYYEWTAPAAGEFTFTIGDNTATAVASTDSGWSYSIDVNGVRLNNRVYFSNDTEVVNTMKVDVEENDVVVIYVNTYDEESDTHPVGEVKFVALYEADEKEASNAFADSYPVLEEGTLVLDGTVETTLFYFEPTELGVYTIKVADGIVLSNWGTTFFPNNQTSNPTNTLTITCSSLGQNYLVGLTCVNEWVAMPEIEISREELEVKVETPWTFYKNKYTPEKFDKVLNITDDTYVDVYDDVEDTAVLGKDGFYHLNSADGPILYVDLDDAWLSLAGAIEPGQVKAILYNDAKEIILKEDYNEAFAEYYANANDEGWYPLTQDLITIYKNVGTHQGWFGEDGYLGLTGADAWMYAMAYDLDGGDPGITAPGLVPDTGDRTNMIPWIVLLTVGVATCVGSIVMKKRGF